MKRGITFLSIMVAVIALAIITATMVISVPNIIESSKLKAFATELMEVQLRIDALGGNYSQYITHDIVIDISNLMDKSIFNGIVQNNKVALHQINLNALGLQNTVYGKMKTSKDMYCVNSENGVVYYIEGFETPDAKYYALDTNLITLVSGKEDLTSNVGYNVVFIPSTYVKSADAIKVTVKVPKAATEVNVTTSGDIIPAISTITSVGNYNQYIVNTGSVKGNYTVTVSYTINGQNKTSTYIVDKYYAEGVYAILYSDGDLRINNDGKTDNYKLEQGCAVSLRTANIAGSSSIPWSSYVTNIKKVTFENEVAPTYIESWFSGCTNLTQINNMEYLDTSNVTSMKDLFKNCAKLQYVELDNFNTSNVTTMSGMFRGCSQLNGIDTSKFTMINCTSTEYMFTDCRALETIDLTGVSTSKVQKATSMFSGCTSLINVDARNWTSTALKDIQYMFSGSNKLKTIYINSLNNLSSTQMNDAFSGLSALQYLDIRMLSFDNQTAYGNSFFQGLSRTATIIVANDSAKAVIKEKVALALGTPNDVTVTTVAEL